MKKFPTVLLLATWLAVAGTATAQAGNDHTGHHPAANQVATADLTDGEVRKINKETGKITLKHGVIKNLDMPGMTMVFQVKDKALLDTIQPGDKVRFSAETENGKLVVTDIQPAM